jgi:lysophospholipase L1-like esterase
VLARDPRIVIVLLGGNDFLRRVPTRETFDNLQTIVTRIRDRGAAVVLVAVSVGIITDPYAREDAELARETSSAFVRTSLMASSVGRRSCRTASTPTIAATSISPTGSNAWCVS